MKLIHTKVTNYRNILDSNPVDIGSSTCLVGKNEAGKTAFLKALEGLNSTDDGFKRYNKTKDYPRRFLSEYDARQNGEAPVVWTEWSIEDADVEAVEAKLGKGSLRKRSVKITKFYDNDERCWHIDIDEKNVLETLAKRFDVSDEERTIFIARPTTAAAARTLEDLDERSEGQEGVLRAIGHFRDQEASLEAIDILATRLPKFLYFSHYDRMSGQISINQLPLDKNSSDGISTGDQLFIDFIEYAGTTLEELTDAKMFEELNAKCEAAANRITEKIFEYWSQNQDLEIVVNLSEGKENDPQPFNQGPVARARVKNNLHRVTVPFSERSAGFIWFFSFLVKFSQVSKLDEKFVILLDEPGLTLHGTAQQDLLRYFKEQLEPNHQLIYTTHSLFMVPADRLETVRTVEDVVIQKHGRRESEGTKIRSDILSIDPQTNFPIFGALGFEVAQGLVIGQYTLLVEGASDILYLQAAASVLRKKGRQSLDQKWAICPSGGIDKVLPFVRLFYGNNLNMVVLTDFERGQKRKIDQIYDSNLLERERIILATEIAEKPEADIEDFFEPRIFITLVNAAYGLTSRHKLTIKKLTEADETTERLVKKAEAYFRLLPESFPTFNHYEPALYLLKHPEILEGDGDGIAKTLRRFEKAFERIAAYA